MLFITITTLLKIGFVLALLLGIAPLLVWAERRQSAMMQDRVGPVRAGIPLPGYQWLVAGGLAALTAIWLGHVALSYFLYDGSAFAWGLVPVVGPLGQAVAADSWLPLGAMVVQTGAFALAMFAYLTKIDVADFIRGPLAKGALGVAVASAAFAAIALIGGVYFVATVGMTEASPSGMNAGVYFGMAFVGALVAAIHVAASWVVKHSVDKRGHFTLFGQLHSLADAMKMIWKEDFTPPHADKLLYSAAPIIATIPAFATFAVIPFGPDVHWGPEGEPFAWLFSVVNGAVTGTTIPLQVASLNVGILYIFAIAGTGIIGAAIAGYSSDNKYSLLGGIRAASQMVSYEVTLGLTLVGCFMIYETLLLDQMVAWQQAHVWGFLVQPLGLILFFFSSIAEMKRVPFDAPEGESEIVAGYFLEYSGMKFGLFMTGEFVEHVVTSALIVTLFFGGYDVPFLHEDGFHFAWLGYDVHLAHIVVVLLSVGAFIAKMGVIMFLQLQVRWTLPRFRYDQIMQLCWKIILPLSLANILITGVVILLLQ